MTRKDYVAIAAALADSRPIALSEIGFAQLAQWEEDRKHIATVLGFDNIRFDRERFCAACEGSKA